MTKHTDYSYIRKGSWGDRPPANAGRDRETGELWIRIGDAHLKLTDAQGYALLDALGRLLADDPIVFTPPNRSV